MYTADERTEIITIQQAVIPHMKKLDIPMTPKNYTILYQYVGGEDHELNSVMDVMMKRNEQFTEDIMDMLYEQFGGDIHESEMIKLRNELQILVTELYSSIGEMAGQSNHFSSSIIDMAQKISGAESVLKIREIVSEIVSETRDFGEKSAHIGARFDAAQEEMTVLREALSSLQDEVRRDELTGIANRRAFDEMLDKQISLSKRKSRPFSLLLIDVDHFKNINDTFGHTIGDEVLRFIAKRIESRIRKEDLAARFGGEEFTVLLPETLINSAVSVAEGIRSYFSKTRLNRDSKPKTIGKVTISVGVAEYINGETATELINRADSALYKAKKNGRNQISTVK